MILHSRLLRRVLVIAVVLFSAGLGFAPRAHADLKDTAPWTSITQIRQISALAWWNGSVVGADVAGGLALVDPNTLALEVVNTGDGLSSDVLTDLAVDPDGDLWIATGGTGGGAAGIMRLDAAFVVRVIKDLADLRVTSLDTDGNFVYYGTSTAGAGRISGGLPEAIYTAAQDGLVDDRILAVAADGGRAWFGTPTGISRLANNVFTTIDDGIGSGTGEEIRDVIAGDVGVFVASAFGVHAYDETNERWVEAGMGLAVPITALAFDGDDVLALTDGRRGYRLAVGSTSWSQEPLLPAFDGTLSCLLATGSGGVWYGGTSLDFNRVNNDPVALLANADRPALVTARGLFGADARSTSLDGNGGLWVSFQAPFNGVSHWRPDGSVVSYNYDEATSGFGWCSSTAKFAIEVMTNGDVWVGNFQDCLTRMTPHASDDPTLATYEHTPISTDGTGLRLRRVFELVEDPHGRLWVLSDNELGDSNQGFDILLDPAQPDVAASWMAITPGNSLLADGGVPSVTFQGDDIVWICVEGQGVQRWDINGPFNSGSEILPFSLTDPQSWDQVPSADADPRFEFAQPRELAIRSDDGRMFLATADRGLFIFDYDPTAAPPFPRDVLIQWVPEQQATPGLLSATSEAVRVDADGETWVATAAGLNRVIGTGIDLEVDSWTTVEAFELFALQLRGYSPEVISPLTGYSQQRLEYDAERNVLYIATRTGVSRFDLSLEAGGGSQTTDELSFVVYPNPFPDPVTGSEGVFLHGIEGDGQVTVQVYNLEGGQILNTTYEVEDLDSTPVWDVKYQSGSDLTNVASGMYLVRVIQGDRNGTQVLAVER